jgi:glycosyltransferase involved in cell wall biosynthesis
VWTIKDQGELINELNGDVSYRTLRAKGKLDVSVPIQFIRYLRAERPDILQSFLYYDNLLARVSSIFHQNTHIITGVRAIPNNPPLFRQISERLTFGLSDSIVSNSDAGAEYVMNRGASREKIKVIPNGRDIEKYANGEADRELYQSLNLAQDEPIVGTVSRLVRRKGHYDLLDAWPSVLDSHPQAQLLLVGDGPEREALEQYGKNLDCRDSVIFAGRRDDVPDLLDLMDVFVFPSYYEGLPGALIEAMIAGLPVVATPVDGNSELIEEGDTGLFVPPHDSEVLADRLTLLLSDSEYQDTLGTAARDFAQQEFSIGTMVSEFSSIYLKVGKENRRENQREVRR